MMRINDRTMPVFAATLPASGGGGGDPIMAETLGLKRDQIEGLRDHRLTGAAGLERLQRDADGLRRLAQRYLTTKSGAA